MNDLTPQQFRGTVQTVAAQYLAERAKTAEGQQQIQRFGMAFATAARTAKRPADFYRCAPGSIAAAAAMSLDTGLMPGGAMPDVWLIPRGSELQWMPSHRGLIRTAQEAGYQVRAVPVHRDDHIKVEGGEVVELEQDPDAWPDGLDDLRGVAVYVTRLSDGATFCRAWVPAKALTARKNAKGAGPVWKQWPVEMAMKSAIRFVFARGYVPVESVQMRTVMAADTEVIDVEPEPVPSTDNSLSPEDEATSLLLGEDAVIPTGDPSDCEALEEQYKAALGDGWKDLLEQAGGSIAQPLSAQPDDVRARYAGLLNQELDRA